MEAGEINIRHFVAELFNNYLVKIEMTPSKWNLANISSSYKKGNKKAMLIIEFV